MNNDKLKTALQMVNAVSGDPATPAPILAWATTLADLLAESGPDPRFAKGSPLPAGVGQMADEYSEVRAERLRIEKQAASVKSRETEIYNVIMSTLNESVDTGASGQTYRVQRIEKEGLAVEDWPSFWAYIQKTGAFDMLQKRLSDKAVADRVEGEGMLPGIKKSEFSTLSFTKI